MTSKPKGGSDFSERVSNPEVTLEIEGHGHAKEAGKAGFFHWFCLINAHGDDGRQYWIEYNAMSLASPPIALWMFSVGWEKGKAAQLPGSVYKLADIPMPKTEREVYPADALTIKRSKNEVAVDLADVHLIIKDDKTWHWRIEDKKKGIKLDIVYHGIGYPTWYGIEKPKALTQHSIAYGYNWSGPVEGTLTIEGREVKIKGAGVRERYISPDTSTAEIGGWEDWMWFHFDEMLGSLYEFKFSQVKDMSLYLVNEKQYFPVGNFNIEHHDWAYHPQLGAFLPMHYKITMEVEAGVLEMAANVVRANLVGIRGEVPDAPVLSLGWDKVDGTFTYKDGRKKTLTHGLGGTSVRLWKPYPSILTPQIAVGEKPGVARVKQLE